MEEITVTGSRIARDVGFTSPVPVTALNVEELSMLEPGLGVSQQLEYLPQFFNNVSSDDIAGRVGADVGQSQLNMRGMGGARTLVLLDGSRVVPSDRRSSVSVDYLPSTLFQRVDVVTGGASAAYGSDAIAGVTNFVLNRQFTGLKLTARGGINEFDGDGQNTRFTATFGDDFLDGRLHLFGSVESRNNRDYRRGREDLNGPAGGNAYDVEWDDFGGYVTNPEWLSWSQANPGVPASQAPVPLRLTRKYIVPTTYTPTGLILQPGFSFNNYMFTEDGSGVRQMQFGANPSFLTGAGTQQSSAMQPGDYEYDLWRKGRYIESRSRLRVELQNVFLGGDFQLTDNTTLWGHAMYGRTLNTSPPTQTGSHAGVSRLTVFQDNAFLPEQVRQAMVAANRQSIRVDQNGFSDTSWGYQERPTVKHYMYSFTGGFDTKLGNDWNLRGSYQYGEAKKESILKNWERNDRFFMAHDAVIDPETGQPVCRIQLVARDLARQGRNLEQELHDWAQANTRVFRTDNEVPPDVAVPLDYPFAVDSIDGSISECRPVNMFGKGNQSQEAIDYIFSDRHKTADSIQTQHFAEIVANGTLHEGWGAGSILGAIGATYREETIYQKVRDVAIDVLGPPYNVTLPDGTVVMRSIPPQIQGGSANLHRFGSQPSFEGGFDVYELFLETIVPLYASTTGPQNLELNLAGRYADYSRAGEAAVWKAGLSFQATNDLRLRATRSHDLREGTFEELFVQQGGGGTPTDPFMTRPTPTGEFQANRSYLISTLSGGDPNIKPEEADTTVLGFVYQPSFIEGMQLSVDKYVVDLTSAIGQFSVQQIVDQCFQTGAFCDRIDRDPATNEIQMMRRTYVNIDAAKIRGWDMEVSYRMEPNFFADQMEGLSLRLIGGYMQENSSTPLGGTKIDQAGSVTLPKKVLTSMVNYSVGRLGINLMNLWSSSTVRNINWVEGVDVDDNSMPSWHNTNLGVFWSGESDRWGTWRVAFNVNNLFDQDPVQRGTSEVGDEIGRRYSLSLETEF